MDALQTDVHKKIDRLQQSLGELPQVKCKLKHIFLHGMYIREITMPKGTMIVSKVHNTSHPYFVSEGILDVFNTMEEEPIRIVAPYWGITEPNTRRVLYIHETTVWKTIHPLDFITGNENRLSKAEKCKLVAEIEDMIIDKHELKLEASCHL